MELVYLWVEDYKNIKKQGFNFSPNFECEFFPIYEKYTDENGEEKEKLQKNSELKITSKENPLKDFFGKNINITAIVGENGSGKTSLMELTLLSAFKNSDRLVKNWMLFYNKEKDLLYISSFYKENIPFGKIDIDDFNKRKSFFRENGKYYFAHIEPNEFYNSYFNPSAEIVSSFFLNYIGENLREYHGAIYEYDYKSDINIFSFPSKRNGKIDLKMNENTYLSNMFKVKNSFNEKKL